MSEERRRLFSSGGVTEEWRPVQFLELLPRKEVASGQEGEQKGRYLSYGSVREAVGSVSREGSLFLERKEDQEERCLGGS